MNIGKAAGIFYSIENPQTPDEVKVEAIRTVCDMATHNGITKAAMLDVIRWLMKHREGATE